MALPRLSYFSARRALTLLAALGLLLSAGCETSEGADKDAGKASASAATTSAKSEKASAAQDASEPDRPAASDAGRPAAVSDSGVDAGRRLDAGRRRDSSVDSGKPDPDAMDAGSDDSRELCVDAGSATHTPTIWLVVDGSGSMLNPLGDKSRWTVLREALLDSSNGVIKRLESRVQWGLFLYDGPQPGGGAITLPDGGTVMFEPATTCPRIVTVAAMLDNYAAIAAAFMPNPLGGSTPTDRAFEALLGQLPDNPAAVSRTSIVFATDGEPNDFCQADAGPFMAPTDVRPRVINAVTQAAARGVETYVINLAADDMLLTQHLEQVAKAGNTGKPPFAPSDQAALAAALADIVEMNANCNPPQP